MYGSIMALKRNSLAITFLVKNYAFEPRLIIGLMRWVGSHFFFINKAVDPGLIQVLEHEIVPRLEQDAPALVSEEALKADPLLHQFTLIFDREGYSPDFMARMRKKRIACITYHKYPKDNWDQTT